MIGTSCFVQGFLFCNSFAAVFLRASSLDNYAEHSWQSPKEVLRLSSSYDANVFLHKGDTNEELLCRGKIERSPLEVRRMLRDLPLNVRRKKYG